jgi:hypothetical protein
MSIARMINSQVRKLLFSGLALLGVLLLAAPRIIGSTIHSATVDVLTDLIPTEADTFINVTQTEYAPGWFNSIAKLDIEFIDWAQPGSQPLILLLDLHIKHGPLLRTRQGWKFGAAWVDIEPRIVGLDLQSLTNSMAGENSAPEFFLFSGLFGEFELGFSVDMFSAGDSNGTLLQLGGIKGAFNLHRDLSSVADFRMDSLQVTTEYGSNDLTVNGLRFESSKLQIEQILSPGSLRLGIDQLSSDAPIAFEVDDFSLDYGIDFVEHNPALLSLSQNFLIATMQSEFPVNALRWETRISQINRDLLEEYIRSGTAAVTLNSNIAEAQETLAVRLLRENLALNSLIESTAYEGEHQLHLAISWHGVPNLVGFEALDIKTILAALEIQLLINADAAALLRSPLGEMTEAYLQQDLLHIENGRIILDGNLADSKLLINQETIPLEEYFAI